MPFRERRPPPEPRSVGELIEGLSRTTGWAERLTLGKLRARWPEIAGLAVAANAEPVRLERGVLTLRAVSGAWATELALLGRQIVARAERALGSGCVLEVRVISGEAGGRKP